MFYIIRYSKIIFYEILKSNVYNCIEMNQIQFWYSVHKSGHLLTLLHFLREI